MIDISLSLFTLSLQNLVCILLLRHISIWTHHLHVLESHMWLVTAVGGMDLEVTIFVGFSGLQRCSVGGDEEHHYRSSAFTNRVVPDLTIL